MKGILMRPWKIKAIAGSSPEFEWQTRRLGGLKEINQKPDMWKPSYTYNDKPQSDDNGYWFSNEMTGETRLVKPRYQVGDVVCIKEVWATNKRFDNKKPSELIGNNTDIFYKSDYNSKSEGYDIGRWRSPLFMPEWAARDFIQITGVRSERLQEITEEDAFAESCSPKDTLAYRMQAYPSWNARLRYAELWDSTNPKTKWDTNPFVWRIEFKKVNHEEEKWI